MTKLLPATKHYTSHLSTSVSTGKVFRISKHFCWAHILNYEAFYLQPKSCQDSQGRKENLYLVLWLQSTLSFFFFSFSLVSFFSLSPSCSMTRVRKKNSAFSQEPCNWSVPLGNRRPDFKALYSLPHIYHIPGKCQDFLGWKPSKSFLCHLSHFAWNV